MLEGGFKLSNECMKELMSTGYLSRLNGSIFPTQENLDKTREEIIVILQREAVERKNPQALKLLDMHDSHTENPKFYKPDDWLQYNKSKHNIK